MAWIGLLAGALIGAALYGFRGFVVGTAIGLLVGIVLRRVLPQARAASEAALLSRIAGLESRLATLEARLGSDGVTVAIAPRAEPLAAAAAPVPAAAETVATGTPPVAAPPTIPVRKGGRGAPALVPTGHAAAAPLPGLQSSTPNRLWAWFTGGNAMARVGIVVLFFGVAFLLSYFAEHFTVPPGLKFAGVAVIGAALIGVGARLRVERRAYAMALIGGGLGVLYLTAFAALRLVPLLTPAVAFALLAAIAALAAILALRFDAQALAALAALGGLLAPVLVGTEGPPELLFAYVAVVNATVLAIAWFRAWRALNLAGFVLTFLLGLWWGFEFYRPEYLAKVEPFLALFFAVYVAVPVLNAASRAVATDRRLDAILIFGVPIVAFALQATLVADIAYGLAWSAMGVALVYAALWLGLRNRRDPASSMLAAAHAALAVIFATMTVPLAIDPRWTSAIWAVEAAGVYWIGCRQDSRFARAFALLLQLATGVAFLLGGLENYADTIFVNRQFLGVAAIALSGFATVRFGDRRAEQLSAVERTLLHLVFAWACVWWLGGGGVEVLRHVATRLEAHAAFAWVIGSVMVAMLLARPLRWPRLGTTVVVLLPAISLAVAHDLWHHHTSMVAYGWAVYPLAWTLHFFSLSQAELRLPEQADATVTRGRTATWQWLFAAHALGALLLLGQIAWEAGEWTARVTPRATAWAACAHLIPLAAYLFAVSAGTRRRQWPLRAFATAYSGASATIVASALGAGFVALAILHPGDASPLPYVPVFNPVDITLLLALGALASWGRVPGGAGPVHLHRWLAAGAFIALNGVVLRTVHHWLDVPWQFDAMVASKPLQAALTLTWTTAALALMVVATRRGMRTIWLAGAGLLAAAVVKLFVVDLAALSGLTRVVAFLGVGALLLVIGYVAPLPPAESRAASNAGRTTPEGPRNT